LREQRLGEEEIAARFFVSVATVRQRLRLVSVSPRLLDHYAEDEMTLEQIMAFSITNDHVRQEQVWDTISRSHSREPYYIRRLLTETAIRASDRRAVYVGIEAYEAAGGVTMRDLFDHDQGGWLQDPALLEQLAMEKLKADAEAIQASEGWKWVEAAFDFPYGHTTGLRRVYGEQAEMTEDELARYDATRAGYDKLNAEYAEADEYSEATEQKLEELGAELDRLNDRPYVFDPQEVARGGVFVSLGVSGEPKVERGFVRPEDEPKYETDLTDDIGDDHDAHVSAPPVTGAAGGEGTQPDDEDETIKPLPDRLVLDLTAARTIALRNAPPIQIPQQFDEPFQRRARHFEILLGLLKILFDDIIAARRPSPDWLVQSAWAIARGEAILAGDPDPEEPVGPPKPSPLPGQSSGGSCARRNHRGARHRPEI